MFATLHAGIGVKQTHSYARSLKIIIRNVGERGRMPRLGPMRVSANVFGPRTDTAPSAARKRETDFPDNPNFLIMIATATRLALLGGYLEHPRHSALRIHIAAGRQHPVPPQPGEDVGRIVRHHKNTLRAFLTDVVGALRQRLGLGETDAAAAFMPVR